MKSKVSNNCCNVCRSVESKLLHAQPGGYFYAICKTCGHVYQTSRKNAAHYHTLPYESQWSNYLEHSRSRANYILDFCKEYINEKDKIVDIGCGPGGTIKYLKEAIPYADITGITSTSDKGIMIGDFEVEYGDFEKETNSRSASKDFAIMCHVLEHFIDPQKALKKVSKMLRKGGYVYVEVPSFYWAEVRSNPQFCPVHLSYFTKSKLKHLLEQSGFVVVKLHESGYWGNLKVLAKKEKVESREPLVEAWKYKLIKWQFNKLLLHRVYKFLKKTVKVNAND